MNKFNIGDRVRGRGGKGKGTIEQFDQNDPNYLFVRWDIVQHVTAMHRELLIRLKPKSKRKEFWVIKHDCSAPTVSETEPKIEPCSTPYCHIEVIHCFCSDRTDAC